MVSVITIFLNEARFLAEAVESVLAQTVADWELLLVDDGSEDASTATAREYAGHASGRIRYLEHPGHENRGMSASRNLGLREAAGELLAFVDADDTWLPDKLERQVPRLLAAPDIDMLYGATQYWHGWTGRPEDAARDHFWQPVARDEVFAPPRLLLSFLRDEVRMPCIGSVLARRRFVERIGGWEDAFRDLHEDQVFFSKVCLEGRVLATTDWVDRYRQHDDSCCARSAATGGVEASKHRFLDWLEADVRRRGLAESALDDAIARQRGRR